MMQHKIISVFQQYKVESIAYHSQGVIPQSAFFAIRGQNYDGNQYIEEALQRGAVLVFSDHDKFQDGATSKQYLTHREPKVIFVEDARLALAVAAGILYPLLPSNIIAVTGTNGKSSIVSYVHQLLTLLGQTSACIGTLGIDINIKHNIDIPCTVSTGLTTYDPVTFRQSLHMLAMAGVDNVVCEASSHGLDQKRLGDIKVRLAAFSSFSQDHLDYHQTMERYLEAKMTLFTRNLASAGNVVINSDMSYQDSISRFFHDHNIAYSTVGKAGDVRITNIKQTIAMQSITFTYKNHEFNFITDIIGSFQAVNLLIAAKLVINLGYPAAEVLGLLTKLQAVKGRLQRITNNNDNFQVFVDYAHTPDALAQSLKQLKMLKTTGKLIVVFGCGGNRDRLKRPIMGKIAHDLADIVIITDDNPRNENAALIRNEIMAGAPNAQVIANRKEAITYAIQHITDGDILLIAGKGHEEYQIIGSQQHQFSDAAVAKTAIELCADSN